LIRQIALFFIFAIVSAPGMASIEIPLYEKGSDVFYLSGSIDGLGETEFLLDTGAGYSAISDKSLRILEQKTDVRYLRSLNSRLANGWVSKVEIYSIGRVEIGQECVLNNVEVAVVPGLSRNILGLNALRQMGHFSISFSPLALTVGRCQ